MAAMHCEQHFSCIALAFARQAVTTIVISAEKTTCKDRTCKASASDYFNDLINMLGFRWRGTVVFSFPPGDTNMQVALRIDMVRADYVVAVAQENLTLHSFSNCIKQVSQDTEILIFLQNYQMGLVSCTFPEAIMLEASGITAFLVPSEFYSLNWVAAGLVRRGYFNDSRASAVKADAQVTPTGIISYVESLDIIKEVFEGIGIPNDYEFRTLITISDVMTLGIMRCWVDTAHLESITKSLGADDGASITLLDAAFFKDIQEVSAILEGLRAMRQADSAPSVEEISDGTAAMEGPLPHEFAKSAFSHMHDFGAVPFSNFCDNSDNGEFGGGQKNQSTGVYSYLEPRFLDNPALASCLVSPGLLQRALLDIGLKVSDINVVGQSVYILVIAARNAGWM